MDIHEEKFLIYEQKNIRQKSSQRGSNRKTEQNLIKATAEAITDYEIAEYVDPFPFKLLTEEEKRQAREEIAMLKNGVFFLDGLKGYLYADIRMFQQ